MASMWPYPKATSNPGSPSLAQPVVEPSDSVPYCCHRESWRGQDRKPPVKNETETPTASHLRSPDQVVFAEVRPRPQKFTWLALSDSASGRTNRSASAKIGPSRPLLHHPSSKSDLSTSFLSSIQTTITLIDMPSRCRSGLLEQRIETTFQVVSILIGYAPSSRPSCVSSPRPPINILAISARLTYS